MMMKRSAGVVASADMEEAEPAMEMDMMVTEEANDEDKVGGLKDYRSDSSVAREFICPCMNPWFWYHHSTFERFASFVCVAGGAKRTVKVAYELIDKIGKT